MAITDILIVLKFIFFALASWVLVHVFAILGFFIAFAFPIRLIFFPNTTGCILCSLRAEGEWCLFCRRKVDKRNILPMDIRSFFLNFVLLLSITVLSVVLVFGESKLLFKLGFPPTSKTASFVIPSERQHLLGEVFPMEIKIVGMKEAVNAVQADIGFDPENLEVMDVSEENSFAKVFVQKVINNQEGYVRLTGGLPNPGYSQNEGTFGTVLFKTKKPGTATVRFLPSSLVMANDGRGTNILKENTSVSYLILPEKIPEEEKTLQEKTEIVPRVVLGEETEEVKIKLYEENKILVTSLDLPIVVKQSLVSILGSYLEQFDRFVLNLWSKVFS